MREYFFHVRTGILFMNFIKMKHPLSYLLLFTMAIGLISFYSCSDDHLVEELEITGDNSRTTKGGTTMPSFEVKKGILYFNSSKDVSQMIDFLDEKIASLAEENYETMSLLEKRLGHKSLYISEYTKGIRNVEEEYTTDEIRTLLNEDYINDPAIKLLLNEYYELGVGEDVIVFQGLNIDLTILNSDPNTLENFRNSPKGSNVVPFDIVDKNVVADHDFLIIAHDTSNANNIEVDFRSNDYTLSAGLSTTACNAFDVTLNAQVKREWNDAMGFHWELIESDFNIDWGDGSSTTVANSQFCLRTHTYDALGTYSITVTADYEDEDGNSQTATITKSITLNEVCSSEATEASAWEETSNNELAMSSKLWFKNGLIYSRVGAFTHAWYWKASKAKWKREKAELDVNVTGNWSNSACTYIESDTDYDDCNNCKKVEEKVSSHMSTTRTIKDGDAYSQHKAQFGNKTLIGSLTLYPCQ